MQSINKRACTKHFARCNSSQLKWEQFQGIIFLIKFLVECERIPGSSKISKFTADDNGWGWGRGDGVGEVRLAEGGYGVDVYWERPSVSCLLCKWLNTQDSLSRRRYENNWFLRERYQAKVVCSKTDT